MQNNEPGWKDRDNWPSQKQIRNDRQVQEGKENKQGEKRSTVPTINTGAFLICWLLVFTLAFAQAGVSVLVKCKSYHVNV